MKFSYNYKIVGVQGFAANFRGVQVNARGVCTPTPPGRSATDRGSTDFDCVVFTITYYGVLIMY